MLYPLKFKPILKALIWGGHNLAAAGKKLPRNMPADTLIGESWEISGLEGNVSVVSNGFLKSNDLRELAEVYMGDLMGDKVYEKYGDEFPVLIKLIDAQDNLSIQVHPCDELAEERHCARGKTEMWYVVDCKPGASVLIGFKRETSKEEYLRAVAEGTVPDLLMRYEVKKGDIYFIPPGTVHTIGKGVVIAEVQETSDIMYRIYDWGRKDADGNPRDLHIKESVDAIDFSVRHDYFHDVNPVPDSAAEAIASPYFTTNIVRVTGEITRNYSPLDSFVAYVCVEGSIRVSTDGGNEKLAGYESLLIPAQIDEVHLSGDGTILEVFIGQETV